ncbi:MAG: DNA recombination protein RmuC [Clostridia bacterium]
MEIILLAIIIILVIALIFLNFKKNNNNELNDIRKELNQLFIQNKDDISNKLTETSNASQMLLTNLTNLNENKLENNRKNMEEKLTNINKTIEDKLYIIQKENNEKLEKMRATVEEKLQDTLDKKLGESFKLVSDRLETVHKGLGEMQALAQGVGDLKKVFTNVKTRGSWGEIQLSNILEQFLSPEQYICNAKVDKKSNEIVEFAVKFPGKNDNETVLLPIDSKFPIEDYNRLIVASETSDKQLEQEARISLSKSIIKAGNDIHNKYIKPPFTTDFAIMFLPTESLYAEVLKDTVLWETLTNKLRIVVTGPTTFVALLNSLQMGFRTLAIEKKTSEVWILLR